MTLAAGTFAGFAWLTGDDGSASRPMGTRVDPQTVADPVALGVELPDGFFQVLPRDFIEPVYEPEFVAGDDSGWPDDAIVIGVAQGDEAKAYPVSLLNSREMVIDDIDGTPIVVTWCPLCGTALVHRREIDGDVVVFGVQGALWMNAMTWWDHDTGSIWSQPLGQAILGPRAGQTVELLPSEFTTWGAWWRAHPESVALDVPAARTGYDLGDFYVVVQLNGEVRAYSVSRLRAAGVVNDVVGGIEVAVVSDPTDEDGWAVFSRRVGDDVVELEIDSDVLRDRGGDSTFHPRRGWGLTGAFGDETLTRLPSFVSLPGGGPMREPIFGAFWPDGTVWRP